MVFKSTSKLFLGPLVFVLIAFLAPIDGGQARVLAVVAWMILWWVTQAVPIGITALLPMVLFPALEIDTLKNVTSNYANPIIYLFFGGFVLGIAIEKWRLHSRFALKILERSGNNPRNIVAGSMLATAVMSMWISNTAATMMMLPITLSIVELIGDQFESAKSRGYFTVSLLLGMAYAANIGGMTTLIGTPPNLVLAAFASENLGIEIGFSEWLLMAAPLVIVLFITAFLINTRLLFPISSVPLVGIKTILNERITRLGKPSIGEKRVALVFVVTALLWILRSPLSEIPGLSFLSDPLIAVASAITLFILPSGEGRPILIWSDTKSLPWDILLLFGGGLSMAAALASSGLVADLGALVSGGDHLPWFLVILILVGLAIFLTEGMSNVALVSAFVPIIFGVAVALGGDPLELSIPVTLAASCAFMLPIATPPNAIIFSSEKVSMRQMVKAGFVMNILAILMIAIYTYLAVPIVFG